ncbi:MAG: LytR C-terminal domain-containing protein [Candidatus Falkowbacteria bacterium]
MRNVNLTSVRNFLHWHRLKYTIVSTFILLCWVLVFGLSTRYLWSALDRAFTTNEAAANDRPRLLIAEYRQIVSKLQLPQEPEIATTTTSTSTPTDILPSALVTSTTDSVIATSSAIEAVLLPIQKISIINTTNKTGIASGLKSQLSTLGFINISVGNQRPTLNKSQISYAEPINQVELEKIITTISKRYDIKQVVNPALLPNQVVISIGNR